MYEDDFSSGSIVYTYDLPEKPFTNDVPSRTLSFYWLTNMSLNTGLLTDYADLQVSVEYFDDQTGWNYCNFERGQVISLDEKLDFEDYADGSSEVDPPVWADYAAETASTKKWYHASVKLKARPFSPPAALETQRTRRRAKAKGFRLRR